MTLNCVSSNVGLSQNNFAASVGDTIVIDNQSGSSLSYTPTGAGTASNPLWAMGTSWTFIVTSSSGGTISMTPGAGPCTARSAVSTFTAGGGGSSSSFTPAPGAETLSLAVASSGATCTGDNPTGYAGSWLTLPRADQCSQSGPTSKLGAKLLGWATSASLPVDRAQAQIDKKWDVIDEVIDGQLMICIPGGMATFVSGSNNLFPIWSA